MQLSIKKLRVILSFALLIEVRSITPKIIKISGLLLKPVPSFLKSVHGWMPATAGVVTTHALSGATTEVKSYQGNSLSVKTGEEVSFQFYTSRYTAGSYRVSGLPNGLSYDGRNTISGSISEAGNYSVNIVGYRGYSQNGSPTPTFLLSIDASDPAPSIDSDADGVDDSSDSFPDDPKRASGSDFDGDGTDDEFDDDDDNDGVVDTSDLYPKDALRASGNDADGDGTDDEFDGDRDGDGADNATDQFPDDPNRASADDLAGDSNETVTNNFTVITNLSGNWFDTWFGIFYTDNKQNWIFHSHLGWLYLSSIGQDTFWLYDSELGWLFTSKVLYPYFFRDQTQNWLFQLEDSSTFRFWDYATSSKIH